jgi:uncharacterized protein (UPF0335 family)
MTVPDVGGIAGDRLRSFIERIERLEEEKRALNQDIKEVYGEAKGTGFDTKIMRQLVKERRMDKDALDEQQTLLDVYRERSACWSIRPWARRRDRARRQSRKPDRSRKRSATSSTRSSRAPMSPSSATSRSAAGPSAPRAAPASRSRFRSARARRPVSATRLKQLRASLPYTGGAAKKVLLGMIAELEAELNHRGEIGTAARGPPPHHSARREA